MIMPTSRAALGVFVLHGLGLVAAACTAPAVPATGPKEVLTIGSASASSALSIVTPTPSAPTDISRWVAANAFLDLGDGRRGAVIGGRRIILQGTKADVIDAKPIVALGLQRRVPAALGGGWLFVGDKHVYFGATYDGVLRLLASDVDASQGVGVGHDVVLFHGASGPVAIQPSTGARVPPPIANAEQLFGMKTGEVAARTKSGDVFLSLGKGRPFAKVSGATNVEMIAYDGKGFVLSTPRGQERLSFDGKVSPRPNEPGMTTTDNIFAFVDEWPDMSKPPPEPPEVDRMLERLTVAMADGSVIAVREKDLVAWDGKTGKVASKQAGAFAGYENCFPIRGGTPAFIGCNGRTEMTLFRVASPSQKPILERAFKGVYSQDFGSPPPDAPLALGKKCDGSELRGAFCVRSDDGKWTEIAPPPDPEKLLGSFPMVVHVAASRDGAPYAFGWEGGNGSLVIVDGKKKAIRRIKKTDIPKWAADGLRWDEMTIRDGNVRFLISQKSSGVVELRADGTVVATPLDGHLSAVGGKGLLVGRDGSLKETLDAGVSFHDITPPPGGADPEHIGCVEGGCTVGPWHRLGWGR